MTTTVEKLAASTSHYAPQCDLFILRALSPLSLTLDIWLLSFIFGFRLESLLCGRSRDSRLKVEGIDESKWGAFGGC
jgi:hypothetical protein